MGLRHAVNARFIPGCVDRGDHHFVLDASVSTPTSVCLRCGLIRQDTVTVS